MIERKELATKIYEVAKNYKSYFGEPDIEVSITDSIILSDMPYLSEERKHYENLLSNMCISSLVRNDKGLIEIEKILDDSREILRLGKKIDYSYHVALPLRKINGILKPFLGRVPLKVCSDVIKEQYIGEDKKYLDLFISMEKLRKSIYKYYRQEHNKAFEKKMREIKI